jgi:beta-lactamase regulating signal transducer with metallopeptidase domain
MGTLQYKIISQTVVLSNNSLESYINLNTLFGAVIILAILFLIMLITYFVNIKPNLNQNNTEHAANQNNSVDQVIAQIAKNEEEELVSDYELVAVITAAIYASLGDAVPADGLVVRSIRKANGKRWMNA